MFDIGGGSSEIIWLRAGEPSGRAGRVQAWESMRLGVVSLAERFGGVDVTDETFTAMTAHVAEALAPFVAKVSEETRCDRFHLLGTSGTVTTIAGVHLNLPRYDRRAVDGLWLGRGRSRRRRRASPFDELRPARRQRLHRPRARRSRARRLRDPRGDPRAFPGRAAPHRRPGLARRHPQPDDARGRGRARTGAGAGDDRRRLGPRGRPGAEDPRQDGQGTHALLAGLAGAPDQRSVCRRGQGEGLSLARGLQASGEIDDRFGILRRGARIIDLGCAPAAWCQIAPWSGGAGAVVAALDLLAVEPLPPADISHPGLRLHPPLPACGKTLIALPWAAPPDVILSDMVLSNTTGHRQTDHLRIVGLIEAAVEFAVAVLKPGGAFVSKAFQGGETQLPSSGDAQGQFRAGAPRQAQGQPRRELGALCSRDGLQGPKAAGDEGVTRRPRSSGCAVVASFRRRAALALCGLRHALASHFHPCNRREKIERRPAPPRPGRKNYIYYQQACRDKSSRAAGAK